MQAGGEDDDIRRKAYEYWEEEGRPEGKHEEHWQKAHQHLRGIQKMPEGAADAGTADVSAHDAPEDYDVQDKAMVPENGAETLTRRTEPEPTQAGTEGQDEGTGEPPREAPAAQKKARPRRKTPAP